MKQPRPKRGRSREATSNRTLERTIAKRRPKHQESQCTVCSSSHRLDIERGYLDGNSERGLALRHGLTDSAIHRHVVGTELNRLRHTDTEIFYRRIIDAASKEIGRRTTIADGLRAADRLDKIREREKGAKDDPERRKALLEERVAFAIEGFRRGGVTLTRRHVLEMFSKMPQCQGELLALIYEELAEPRLLEPKGGAIESSET